MNSRSFLVALWRRRVPALVVLIVEMVAVIAWLAVAPKTYTAAATLTATPRAKYLVIGTDAIDSLETTLAALVNSRPVLQDVAGQLGNVRSVGALTKEVTGSHATDTLLIQISVEDRNAKLAAQIANAVSDSLPSFDPTDGVFLFAGAGRAVVPTSASSPDTKIVLLAGLALGIVLAIATAMIRESAVATVDTEDQLSETTGTEVLGSIARPVDVSSVPALRPGSQFAAEFRALRVALEFATGEQAVTTVVLATPDLDPADEWLGVNLAAALADVRHRVLLIDADFRERTRHPALNHPDRPGLGDVLRDLADPLDILIDGPVPRMSVLPIGDVGDTSSATLVELGFHRMIDAIGADFDIVLVVTAPPTQSEDARVMAAGGFMVLSVAEGRVRVKALRELVESMQRARIRMLGTVLIEARRRRAG